MVSNSWQADDIVNNFRSMESLFETVAVRRGGRPHQFARALRALPLTYVYEGQTKPLTRFLDETWTTGLVVVLDGTIVFEEYDRGNDARSKTISWSVAKSFVSALVGIAVEEGHIESIQQLVSEYVRTLRGTGYDGVSVKDLLQMSSGIRFNEGYGDFFSDINRLGRAFAFGASLEDFVASRERQRAPGTLNHYVSVDTQVLGMLLRRATGETLASYLESRWRLMGSDIVASKFAAAARAERPIPAFKGVRETGANLVVPFPAFHRSGGPRRARLPLGRRGRSRGWISR
jgi:CubicO group peptidase (beta-lactamase class C family)